MVSLKDIAKECQVSVATVSKALNDHADISEERKKMIRERQKKWDIVRICLRGH